MAVRWGRSGQGSGWSRCASAGVLALLGCGQEDRVYVEPEQAETVLASQVDDAPFFDFSHRVEIEVELAPADWQSLRGDGRSLTALFNPDLPFEYASYVATVSIDGQ